MYTSFKNFTEIRVMGRNALTFTRRVTKKSSSGINEKMIKKGKGFFSEEMVHYKLFLELTHSCEKVKLSTREWRKCLLLT